MFSQSAGSMLEKCLIATGKVTGISWSVFYFWGILHWTWNAVNDYMGMKWNITRRWNSWLTEGSRNFAIEGNSGPLEFKGSVALKPENKNPRWYIHNCMNVHGIMGCFLIMSSSCPWPSHSEQILVNESLEICSFLKRKACMRSSKQLEPQLKTKCIRCNVTPQESILEGGKAKRRV